MPAKYPTAESFRWMTTSAIAREIDRTPKLTKKLLDKVAYLGLRPRRFGRVTKYPAGAVEVLKALLDIPYRPVPTPDGDWLSTYEKKDTPCPEDLSPKQAHDEAGGCRT